MPGKLSGSLAVSGVVAGTALPAGTRLAYTQLKKTIAPTPSTHHPHVDLSGISMDYNKSAGARAPAVQPALGYHLLYEQNHAIITPHSSNLQLSFWLRLRAFAGARS